MCRFLGEVNELPPALHAAWSGDARTRRYAFVRPQDLDLSPTRTADGAAHVELVRDLGATLRIEARHPALAKPLVAIQERRRFDDNPLAPGQAVAIGARRWTLFDEDSTA